MNALLGRDWKDIYTKRPPFAQPYDTSVYDDTDHRAAANDHILQRASMRKTVGGRPECEYTIVWSIITDTGLPYKGTKKSIHKTLIDGGHQLFTNRVGGDIKGYCE